MEVDNPCGCYCRHGHGRRRLREKIPEFAIILLIATGAGLLLFFGLPILSMMLYTAFVYYVSFIIYVSDIFFRFIIWSLQTTRQ